MNQRLSYDFIAGLIAGEGYFGLVKNNNGKIPVFALKMHVRDKELLTMVKNALDLDAKIHEYTHNKRHYAALFVRNKSDIYLKIIPIFKERLFGYKKIQFDNWEKEIRKYEIAIKKNRLQRIAEKIF